MNRRIALLPLLLFVTVVAGCGGDDQDSVAAPSSPEPTTATASTTVAPVATSPALSETPAQVAARQLCENTEIIDEAFSAFINSGPSPGLAEQVRQFTAQLATYKATFTSDPEGAAAAQVITLLERQGPGWEALYGEGEAAYQKPKANGSDIDILGEQIEAAWAAAMTDLGFTATNAPHPPVVYAEGDC